jgi:16S rRNA (adenine1518-N6/adenine1519-N6)-dimethyltransferase
MSAEGLIGARRVRELFESHGVRPRKSLGQNFVVDPNTIRKVLALANLDPKDSVLEIGAGVGSLTIGLADAAAHVIAIEQDEGLIPALREVLGDRTNVDVVVADATALDLSVLDATKLVANLPYNLAAPLVLEVLASCPRIGELVVMTQLEVAERLAAKPGSKVYGAPSAKLSLVAEARLAARVSRNAFWPVPHVESGILVVGRRSESVDYLEETWQVVTAAFSQRRKSLRNSLAVTAGGAAAAEAALRAAGLDPTARAEQVDATGFAALQHALSSSCGRPSVSS